MIMKWSSRLTIGGSDTRLYETGEDGDVLFSGTEKIPCILGHKYSGEVVEVGKHISNFKKGDIVTGERILRCGKCLPCRYGMLNRCENEELIGLAADGAFAENIALKAKYCWSLNKLDEKFERDDILKIGTLIELLGCAYNGVFFSSG